MVDEQKKRNNYAWAVFQLRDMPAKLIGIVYDQPDQASAIKAAIKNFKVPEDQRDRLMALRQP